MARRPRPADDLDWETVPDESVEGSERLDDRLRDLFQLPPVEIEELLAAVETSEDTVVELRADEPPSRAGRKPGWTLWPLATAAAAAIVLVLALIARSERAVETSVVLQEGVVEPGEEDVDANGETVLVGPSARGGVVTVALETEASGLRPWEDACNSACINIATSMMDKLVEVRADGTYGPWLAESFTPNEDYTEWVFELRQGVRFHNGELLSAATIDAIYPFWQVGDASAGVLSAAGIESIEATGEYEFTVVLSNSNSALPAYFERPQLLIFEPNAAQELAEDFSLAPVGTGPFVIERRVPDEETVVVRNPSWWYTTSNGDQLPFLDSIVFRPTPDEGTRLDLLLSGEVDAMQTLRQGTIRDAQANSDGLTLYERHGNNVGGGLFNVAVPPFDDVRVRRGLVQMIDQAAEIDALGGTGVTEPGTQWFSSDSPWYSERVADAWPKFDFEVGKETLQVYVDDPDRSDGKATGEPIDVELSCPPDPTLIASMEVLEESWTRSGLVTVELTQYDQQTHINYALGEEPDFVGQHGAHCWRFSSDADPSYELNRQFLPYNSETALENGLPETLWSPVNFFNYFDADLLGWLSEAVSTDDFDDRYALYEQVMLKIADDVMLWYANHTAYLIATQDDVVGLDTWELPDGTLGAGHPGAEGRWFWASLDD